MATELEYGNAKYSALVAAAKLLDALADLVRLFAKEIETEASKRESRS